MKSLKSLMFALLCFLLCQCASETKVNEEDKYDYYYFSQKAYNWVDTSYNQLKYANSADFNFSHTYVNGIEYTYKFHDFGEKSTYIDEFPDTKLVLKVLKLTPVKLTEKSWGE